MSTYPRLLYEVMSLFTDVYFNYKASAILNFNKFAFDLPAQLHKAAVDNQNLYLINIRFNMCLSTNAKAQETTNAKA